MLKIAYGGASWISTSLGLAILMAGISGAHPALAPLLPLSFVPFFVFMFSWFFFRDPERRPGEDIVSGADGKVVRIDTVDDPDLGPCDRLAVFMSPLDVHVNRFPMAGDVRRVTHHPGKHLPAFNKDSERNERVVTVMKTDLGNIKCIQIAGAVARRILPYAQPGDSVHKAERLGLIKLGSRFDLLIPQGQATWTVEVGQRVMAGRSRVAKPVPPGAAGGASLGTSAEASDASTPASDGADAEGDSGRPPQGSTDAPRDGDASPRDADTPEARAAPDASRLDAASDSGHGGHDAHR